MSCFTDGEHRSSPDLTTNQRLDCVYIAIWDSLRLHNSIMVKIHQISQIVCPWQEPSQTSIKLVGRARGCPGEHTRFFIERVDFFPYLRLSDYTKKQNTTDKNVSLFGASTFSITALSIMTLNIKVLYVTLSITMLGIILSVIMPNVQFYLLLCWSSLSWMSFCWVSRRRLFVKYWKL